MTISRRRRHLLPLGFLILVTILALLLIIIVSRVRLPPVRSSAEPEGVAWPASGQAAVAVADGAVQTSGRERPVPIASLTKIMTALVVLDHRPVDGDDPGFVLTIEEADVEDYERRRTASESVLPVRLGETLTERDALLALLLPSANNVAHLLATRLAGSESAFATIMNAKARSLGLRDTHYADASGIDAATVSTAGDQTLLARHAMRQPTFAWLVRQQQLELESGQRVRNTNRLLESRSYLGVKTGSTTPAGGCFVFAVHRQVDGRRVLVVGAVLGQRGRDLLTAAFAATDRLVGSVGRPDRPR